GGLVGGVVTGGYRWGLEEDVTQSLSAARAAIDPWVEQIQEDRWFAPEAGTYFLARAGSLARAHETRLLWGEATKAPATAMTTAGFRHGPHEVSRESMRFGVWIDKERMRRQDLAVSSDLRKLGAKVMLIGQGLPAGSSDLTFSLPSIPTDWQFLIDIIPAQLAAEHLSHVRGVD